MKIYIQHISLMNVCFIVNHVKDTLCKIKIDFQYVWMLLYYGMHNAIACNAVLLLYLPFYTNNNKHRVLLNIRS